METAAGVPPKYGFWRGLRGVVSGAGLGVFIGCMPLVIFRQGQLIDKAPDAPDPAMGVIHAFNQHGTVIYFTGAQIIEMQLNLVLVPLLFLVAWISPKKNIRRTMLSARWDIDDPYRLDLITVIVVAITTVAAVFLYEAQIFGWLADLWFRWQRQ